MTNDGNQEHEAIAPGDQGTLPARDVASGGTGAHAALRRYTWWNFWIISLDAGSWTVGLAFVDAGAVLPVFASTLTDSKLVIGLLASLPGMGWALLQLLGAANVLHRPRKKRYLVCMAAAGRAPMLAMPALLLLTPFHSKGLMLGVLIGCYAALFLSDGLLGAAWYDIIAKTIPSQLRGRFFATMSFLGALGALGSGWVVKRVLASPGLRYPHQYGILFACLCGGLLLSFTMLTLIREPAGPVSSDQGPRWRAALSQIPGIWRRNRPFRKLVAVAWLTSTAGLAWPFYALYGIKVLGLPVDAGAVFIWAGTLGNMASSPLWAWLNDRKGPRSVLVGTAAARLAAPAAALAVPAIVFAHPALAAPRVAQYLYGAVFLCSGAFAVGSMIGFSNYLLELASPQERPLIVGLGYTLIAPGLVAPMLGGWVVSAWSYQGAFALTLGLGVIGLIASLGLQEPTRGGHPAPYVPPEVGRAAG